MTLEEFTRRWLTASHAPAPEAPAPRSARLTDKPTRTFSERSAPPSRLVKTGRFLQRWAIMALFGVGLFTAAAGAIVKLAPYIVEYAGTYLTF